MIVPQSSLRMRVERIEIPWAEVRSKSKTQSNLEFQAWLHKVLYMPGVSKSLNEVGMRILVTCTRVCLLSMQHFKLEVLLSLWSTEAYTSVAS